MPTLTQLEYIMAVDKEKHFGRAAKHCHVSQPSLSAQVQKVEQELDIIIFDRSKKPVMVTEKGEKIINQARVIINEHKKLFDISKFGQEISGNFHLGVIPTLSSYIIPLFIESFSKKYPKVNLTISEYKTEDIIKKLEDDSLDGGLLITPLKNNQIIERSLFFEPFYAFVSKDHPLQKKSSLKEKDLTENSIWLLNEGHCFRNQVLNLCGIPNQNKVLNNVNFESGNLETLKNLIRKGNGYTLLPHLATLNLSIKEQNNNIIPFQKPIPTREVSLVHSRSFLKEEIINALTEEIIDQIPEGIRSLKSKNLNIVDI
ncbi:MAG: LysR family hydrogen peroxide-inducible transcriptional activator [Thermoproteota archaeon]